MNLQPQAENEMPRKTRSKLEDQREAIFTLRRKHWTYRQIAQWLNERGVPVSHTAVYRFCERAIARRPRGKGPAAGEEPAAAPVMPSFFHPTPPTQTYNATPGKKPRYNELE